MMAISMTRLPSPNATDRGVTAGNPLLPLAAGRALSGAVMLVGAVPLCRLAGVTERPATARKIGVALAVIDGASALAAVAARSPTTRQKVAAANAGTDLATAAVLAACGVRRQGRARMVSAAGVVFVTGGAIGWMRAGRSYRRPAPSTPPPATASA
jgi:hypothetical protein